MKIELRTDPDSRNGLLLALDAPLSGGDFVGEGDLGLTGGNLYIFIDGEEYGSLFFYGMRGKPRIMLGQSAAEEEGTWIDRNPITGPVEPW